jgi:hypothetical protein
MSVRPVKFVVVSVAAAAFLIAASVPAQGQDPKATPRSAEGQVDLSGVWIINGSVNLPVAPSYLPAEKKRWDENKTNLTKNDPASYCLPNGVVRVTKLPYKIVQTPKLVVLLSEGNTHSYRRFFVDGRKHNLDLDPESWTGDSIAHWDGDTLVVDTIGFNDKSWLDDTGKPHSEALHVIERYSRPDYSHLHVQYTIEDDKAFAKPLNFTRLFNPAPNRDLQEYFCTDKNRLAVK